MINNVVTDLIAAISQSQAGQLGQRDEHNLRDLAHAVIIKVRAKQHSLVKCGSLAPECNTPNTTCATLRMRKS